MDIVSSCPFPVTSVIWQASTGAWALTLVCKVTFRIDVAEAALAEQQEPLNDEDNHWNDDPARSLVAPSDIVPFKPRADILVTGHAFAPDRSSVRSLTARVTVGQMSKALEVRCDRWFDLDGRLNEGSPFVKMPLRWERAAGGPDSDNPVGLRFDAEPDAYGRIPIANLQPLGTHIGWRSDRFAPVGLGAIAPHWPSRRRKLQQHAPIFSPRDWSKRPLPGIDFAYFNSAPLDQQIDAVRPDERIVLEHLHRDHARFVTRLPGIHPRATVERAGAREALRLQADTLWIDTDRALCTVAWRGGIGLHSPADAGTIRVDMATPGLPVPVQVAAVPPSQNPPRLQEPPSQNPPRLQEPPSQNPPRLQEPPRSSEPRLQEPPRSSEPRLQEPPRSSEPRLQEPPRLPEPPPSQEQWRSRPTLGWHSGLDFSLKAPLPFVQTPGAESPYAQSQGPEPVSEEAGATLHISANERAAIVAEMAALPFPVPAPARQPPPLVSPSVPVAPLAPVAPPVPVAPPAPIAPVRPLVPLGSSALGPEPGIVLPLGSGVAPAPGFAIEAEETQANPPSAKELPPPPAIIGPLARPDMAPPPPAPAPEPAKETPAEVAAPQEPPPAKLEPEKYTIEQCAKIAVAIACRPADTARTLEEHQLSGADWDLVKNHWLEAMRKELGRGKNALLKRYDAAYVEQVELERGPLSVDEYASLVVAVERGRTGEAVAELKLPAAAPIRIERVWIEKMVKDPAFGRRVRERIETSRES